MKAPITFMFAILAGLLCTATNLSAATPTTRPTALVDAKGCVTSDCHANIKATPVLHGPVANDTCDACHELTSAPAHTYKLKREKADLCTYCHEFDVSAMPFIHKPVKDGECLGCHDPHGGMTRSITREKTMAELCARCHENSARDHKFLHTPVAKGQCDSCHPPHASMFPKLLDAVGTDLCLACHTKFDSELSTATFKHKAMEQGCTKCHDVHGSNQPSQLVQPAVALCESCHEKVKTEIATASYKHSVVTEDKACLTCHTPHGANTAKLMIDQPVKLCLSCHKDPIKLDGKHVVPAASELSDPAMHKHGAIKDGQCSGCHAAHGAAQPALLTKVYSQTIYQPFSVAQYALCFSCHDQRLVLQAQTATATSFRNGDRNLHSVHVKEGQLGRACAVCHTTHASSNARNIRDTTLLKIWNMPIRFAKTETGGSCAPGCHVPWAYDREHPVKAPTSGPAPRANPALVRAESNSPMIIRFEAQAIDGRQVAAPNATTPTVLLLLSREQASDERIISAVRSSIDSPARAQVIAILCGPDATVALPQALPWPTVADPDGKISRELDVRGWPTALVLQTDGLQVARIGGAVESLALKLPPYLALAAKTVDVAAVEEQLSRTNLVAHRPTTLPSMNLKLALKALDENRPGDAYKLLQAAMQVDPDSLPLRVAMIRTLSASRRGPEAITMLQQIDPAALPHHQHELLRVSAMLAMGQWNESKALLNQLLQTTPDLLEAHYLLGTIYQRDGDWQRAAEEYRAARGRPAN